MNKLLLVETTSRASNSCHDLNHTSTIWDNFKKQKKKGSSLALEVLCKQLHYLSQRGSLKRSKTWPLARPLLPIWCSLFANYLRELTLYSCNNFRNAIERERRRGKDMPQSLLDLPRAASDEWTTAATRRRTRRRATTTTTIIIRTIRITMDVRCVEQCPGWGWLYF